MRDRLDALEARLDALASTVRELQNQFARTGGRETEIEDRGSSGLFAGAPVAANASVSPVSSVSPVPPVLHPEPEPEPEPEPAVLGPILGLLGRSLLVLGGGFSIRALTESGALPPAAGVALGIAYAALWLQRADAAAARGGAPERLSALFLGGSSLAIACPLLWEATTRFHMIDPEPAFGLLALWTAAALWIAGRRGLPSLAWAATLLSIATGIGLFGAPHAFVPLLFFLLGLAGATSWLAAATTARPIRGPRWAAALFADFAVVALVQIAARPGGAGENYPELTPSLAILLALVLPAVELLRISEGIIQGRGPLNLFDSVQGVVAMGVGFGGALQIAGGGPAGIAIAFGALAVGAGAYAASIAAARRGRREDFLGLSSIGAAAVLLSGAGLPPAAGAATLAIAALATAGAAAGAGRRVLAFHTVGLLAAGAVAAGLPAEAALAFLAREGAAGPSPAVGGFAVAASAAFVLLAFRANPPARGGGGRIPEAAAASLALLALGSVVILSLGSIPEIGTEPARLAALRTLVLSGAAVALAAAGRRHSLTELGWLSWAVLSVTGLQVLVQDLASGRAAAIFLAFLVYGAALITAPRFLLRRR